MKKHTCKRTKIAGNKTVGTYSLLATKPNLAGFMKRRKSGRIAGTNLKMLLNEIKLQKTEENRKIMEDRSKDTEQKGPPPPKSAIPQISIEDWNDDNIPMREKVANQKIAENKKKYLSRSAKTIERAFSNRSKTRKGK